MYDIIIIGGGPAGITAGIYSARKKLNTLLISKDFTGQVGKTFSIENYPGFKDIQGPELIAKMKEQLKGLENIGIKEGEEVSKVKKKNNFFEIRTDKNNLYTAKVVITASGRNPRLLDVEGEKEFIGKGVSYCTTCDGPLFQDKIVAVVGGGNSGFESAIELSKYCSKVYILEFAEKFSADEILREKAEKEAKIETITFAEIKEIKGEKFVKSLIYKDKKTDKLKELSVDGVFIEIGYVPAAGFVKDLVDFNELEEIKINTKTCATKTPGLFAAGDVADIEYNQIVIAAGEGAKAALSAYKYIQNL